VAGVKVVTTAEAALLASGGDPSRVVAIVAVSELQYAEWFGDR
jgi:hypothetical protein